MSPVAGSSVKPGPARRYPRPSTATGASPTTSPPVREGSKRARSVRATSSPRETVIPPEAEKTRLDATPCPVGAVIRTGAAPSGSVATRSLAESSVESRLREVVFASPNARRVSPR